MTRRMSAFILVAAAVVASILGLALLVGRPLGDSQPWGPVLGDNVIFGRALPLIIALGMLVGAAHALFKIGKVSPPVDGKVRRFSGVTIVNHWVNAVGFLLALTTGAIQYLEGILDVPPPFPHYLIYRLHYIGAALIIFSTTTFLTHALLTSDWRLLPPRGRWMLHLRGLVAELPRPLGTLLAAIVGLNLRRPAPDVGQFTYYEKTVSFPIWAFLIILITSTGLIKAMRYVYPVSGTVLYWASFFHVAAMVMIAAKLLDHLRYVIAPSRWELFKAMVTGWVSEGYVKRFHPAWYRELTAHRPAAETVPQINAERRPEPVTGTGSAD